MRDKAIFFTVYNRPEYLQPSLEQWQNVRGLEKYDIHFRIDPSEKTEEIVDLISKFSKNVNTDVRTIFNLERQGCARNIWGGFNDLFNKYDFLLLAEDDILPSTDVAEYFDFLERKYKDDHEIGFISANYEVLGYDPYKVSRINGFRGQIWGMWKNIWENYVKNDWDFDYSTGVDGGPSGWDWNLGLRVLPKNNLKCIVPHAARSQHIGVVGIHCDETIFDSTQMKSFKPDRAWKELEEV